MPLAAGFLRWLPRHGLSSFVEGLYRGAGFAPFTARIWWQLVPWLAILGLSADHWLASRSRKRTMIARSRNLIYYVSLAISFLFILLSFRPLVVPLHWFVPEVPK